MPGSTLKIVLIDSHPVNRIGFKVVVESTGEFVVAAEASQCGGCMQLIENHLPDVVVIDPELPDRSGLSLIRDLRVSRDTQVQGGAAIHVKGGRTIQESLAIRDGGVGFGDPGQPGCWRPCTHGAAPSCRPWSFPPTSRMENQ